MYQAFGDLDADAGLTRGELLIVCTDLCDEATFNNRFDSFEQLGMLQPVRDKAHQVRYVFNPASAAALLVFQRLAETGGVQELMTLLDRTRAGLRSGVADRRQVEANLAFVRRAFALYADHLLRMVRRRHWTTIVLDAGRRAIPDRRIAVSVPTASSITLPKQTCPGAYREGPRGCRRDHQQ